MRLIDADALKEYLENCMCCDNCPDSKLNCDIDCPLPNFLTKEWERVINEQPTIGPGRNKGKWTLLPNGDAICQECKHVQKSAWDMDGWDNFCHHCGSDMREEGVDE